MIEWIVLFVIVGVIGVLFLLSRNTTDRRGSRDYVRTQRTGESAEGKMDRDRDYLRERERQRHGGSRSWGGRNR